MFETESDRSSERGQPAEAVPGRRAAIADGRRHPLAPEQVVADRIVGWILTAVFGTLALPVLVLGWTMDWFPAWLDWLLGAAWVAFVGGLGWTSQRWPHLEHRHTRIRVGPVGLDLWRGVFWRRVISVPRSRVQHTDVTQGPLQRKYGLATLTVHTAGTEHAKVEVAGLSHATALAVRDYLLCREDDDVG